MGGVWGAWSGGSLSCSSALMAAADVLPTLASPFSLFLPYEACALFPELDEMEGSPMELPPLPVLPWLDPVFTINISMDDEADCRMLINGNDDVESVEADEPMSVTSQAPPPPVVTHTYATRRTAALEENVAQRTIYDVETEKEPDKTSPNYGKPIAIDPRHFALLSRKNEHCINEDYLTTLTPPEGVVNDYDPKPYYAETGAIGKYLIDRGFPTIGRPGSHTLVFLITVRAVRFRYSSSENCSYA